MAWVGGRGRLTVCPLIYCYTHTPARGGNEDVGLLEGLGTAVG